MIRIPEVRALCTRARRPLTGILVAGLLIAPAIASGWRPDIAIVSANAATSSASIAAPTGVELAARNAVREAWRAKVVERALQRVSLRFADRFRIPLDLAHEIHVAALDERIDPEIAFRLVRAESRFRTSAVSPVGAVGLTQLMPTTARWVVPGIDRRQLLEPRTNLRIGFRYLRRLLDQYGDPRLALTAYNRGPGTVDRVLEAGGDPDNGYMDFVLTGDGRRHAKLLRSGD